MKKYIFFFLFGFALTGIFAQDSTVTVHEWGTFTTLNGSDGVPLSGLYADEEKLPRFVKNLDMKAVTDSNAKGIVTKNCALKNVTVKMETPVIYFYADKETPIHLKVNFDGGLITQWYPQRSGGTPHINNCNGDMDFETAHRDGTIEWTGKVLAPNTTQKLTNATTDNVWLSPRVTRANLVQANDTEDVEKFLFYRGIGNFQSPVSIEFDKDGLIAFTNNTGAHISYAMLYYKPLQGEGQIWWAGGIANGAIVKSQALAIKGISKDRVMTNFKNALKIAGLYEDEAAAMLRTWQHSYFETPGVKLFWVVPISTTNKILPLTMSPLPKSLERVMVGRSEILTPGFEDFLFRLYKHGSDEVFYGDRYAEAYRQRYEQIKTKGKLETEDIYYLYPNYTSNKLFLLAKTKAKEGKKVKITITNADGVLVAEKELPANSSGYIFNGFDFSTQPEGVYTVNFTLGDNVHTESILYKN
jgi:hypothetical protein